MEGTGMADALPNPAGDNTTRFESAPDPDGTLIPIPSEAPPGEPIRDDAAITVSPLQNNGFYVSIYNGPPEPPSEIAHLVTEVLTETGMKIIEEKLLKGAPAIMSFLGAVAGVVASVLTTSPLLNEYFARGTMDDGTPVTYVVLTPKG
jgi:hypothetical protein